MNDEQWVAERLRALDPGREWQPNVTRLSGDYSGGDRRRRVWQRGWAWSTGMVAAAVMVLAALPSPARCAMVGVGCPRPAVAVPCWTAGRGGCSRAGSAVNTRYKESGSPNAPVVCEIYTDYECPHCAVFYEKFSAADGRNT